MEKLGRDVTEFGRQVFQFGRRLIANQELPPFSRKVELQEDGHHNLVIKVNALQWGFEFAEIAVTPKQGEVVVLLEHTLRNLSVPYPVPPHINPETVIWYFTPHGVLTIEAPLD